MFHTAFVDQDGQTNFPSRRSARSMFLALPSWHVLITDQVVLGFEDIRELLFPRNLQCCAEGHFLVRLSATSSHHSQSEQVPTETTINNESLMKQFMWCCHIYSSSLCIDINAIVYMSQSMDRSHKYARLLQTLQTPEATPRLHYHLYMRDCLEMGETFARSSRTMC